jgi:hypothetical protein
MSGRDTVTVSGISAVKEASVPATPLELGTKGAYTCGGFNARTGVASGGSKTLASNINVTRSNVITVTASTLFGFLFD